MKIKTLKLAESNFYQSLENALSFDEEDNSQIQQTVKDIIQDVKANGDHSLLEFTKKFDKVDLDNPSDLELPSSILKEAYDSLDTSTQNALNESAQRIKNYHEKQVQDSWSYKEEDGTVLGQKITALDSVGLYVPGGKASYPSSVLMNAIPAKVAGVKNLVMVVPTPNGERNALVLAAAYVANVDRVFTIGGAQAVAALAYGTHTIPQVDKISRLFMLLLFTNKRPPFRTRCINSHGCRFLNAVELGIKGIRSPRASVHTNISYGWSRLGFTMTYG